MTQFPHQPHALCYRRRRGWTKLTMSWTNSIIVFSISSWLSCTIRTSIRNRIITKLRSKYIGRRSYIGLDYRNSISYNSKWNKGQLAAGLINLCWHLTISANISQIWFSIRIAMAEVSKILNKVERRLKPCRGSRIEKLGKLIEITLKLLEL